MPDPASPPKRKRGAPPGNKNALRHGLYARHFTEHERLSLGDMPALESIHEIHMLRTRLDALLEHAFPEGIRFPLYRKRGSNRKIPVVASERSERGNLYFLGERFAARSTTLQVCTSRFNRNSGYAKKFPKNATFLAKSARIAHFHESGPREIARFRPQNRTFFLFGR